METKAAGLCHSDEHLQTGDLSIANAEADRMGIPRMFPTIGGHEGAGAVVEVGEGVRSVKVGDHVAMSFIPSCGRCHYCSTGRQNLCDVGAALFAKGMATDGRVAHRCRGADAFTMSKIGSFAEHMLLAEESVIRIEPDIPFVPAALASCGVATGWGSAVHRADIRPGDTVVVIGTGGVGMSAVQGARMCGAKRVVAVDPVEFKRELAGSFGATHTFASVREAAKAMPELTWGRGADAAIITVGLVDGELVGEALSLVGKGGTVVVTSMANMNDSQVTMSLFELSMYSKEVRGTVFGSGNPRADVPELLSMYREGMLELDELATRTYPLDRINEGYADLREGRNLRGVLVFD